MCSQLINKIQHLFPEYKHLLESSSALQRALPRAATAQRHIPGAARSKATQYLLPSSTLHQGTLDSKMKRGSLRSGLKASSPWVVPLSGKVQVVCLCCRKCARRGTGFETSVLSRLSALCLGFESLVSFLPQLLSCPPSPTLALQNPKPK